MPTSTSIIQQALELISVADPGETPSSSVLNAALVSLNAMLDNWSLERLNIAVVSVNQYALTTATQSYVIGPDGTGVFANTARPIKIEQALFLTTVNGATNRFKLDIIAQERWADIPRKSNTSIVPDALYDDRGYPDSTLYLYPIPAWSAGTCYLELYTWLPLPQFPDLVTNENLAPGYLRAIVYNLAIEFSALYGVQPPQTVVMVAEQAKDAIRAFNDPNPGDPPMETKSNAVAPPAQGPQR